MGERSGAIIDGVLSDFAERFGADASSDVLSASKMNFDSIEREP